MPPSGTPPQGQTNTEPYYSNEDVAILNDIVALAQELLPNLPERERLPTNALFNAYFDILPRIGLETDHDNRYARVLFKIGGLRQEGTLYEKFVEVLSRMGIDIEFGSDPERGSEQLENGPEVSEDAIARTIPLPEDNVELGTPRRRNSESSFWDQGNEVAPVGRPRRNSFSSAAQLTADVAPQNSERPQFLQEIQPRQPSAAIPLDPEIEEDPQDHVGAWVKSHSHREKPRRRRGRSISTHSSLRIRRRALSPDNGRHQQDVIPSTSDSEHYEAASENTAVTSAVDYDSVSTESFLEHRPKQNKELMHIKATLFLQDHTNSVIRRQLPHWRQKALIAREHHLDLNRVAANYDRHVLLSVSFANWQRLWIEKRLARNSKKFYRALEFRVSKARDMYVMVNILQRWALATERHIDRTEAARQHILKTRCFNAWVDITAVNEFKVRRHVLNKFFGAWRQRHSTITATNDYALQRYEDNLVEKTYWLWIEKRLGAKATAVWAQNAKRRALFSLIAEYHDSWENHRTAEDARRFQLMWDTWRIWREKTNKRARQAEEATDMYEEKICRKAFAKWTKEARIIPVRNFVQSDVKQRRLRDAFDIWLHRTRQERHAAEVDRTNILREAITSWRYQLRTQRLHFKVNLRIKTETVCRWMQAQQVALLERREKEKWLRRIMHTWVVKARAMRDERLRLEAIAESYLTWRSQKLVLYQWSDQVQVQRERESMALTLYQPRLLERVVLQWFERNQHLQKLENWSRDAGFYFLTTRYLKKWRASTEASKREKRKAAYVQVRRTVKINLATAVIRTWRDQARHIIDLQNQAQSVRQNKDVVLGMEIFDKWRGQVADLAELESIWQHKVLRKQLSVWRERSSAYQALESEAVLTYYEKRESRAFKKWNLAALQIRAQTNYAYDIQEKNAKRTFRKMLTYWRHKAALKRPPKIPEPEEVLDELGATARAENWSEYGDGVENEEWVNNEAVPSTPIPGYLSTPSKRSERVMAVAARFSTTPRAPISTPFERQLRAQYPGGQFHSFRKGAGKSTLGMGRGFDDIEEKRHE